MSNAIDLHRWVPCSAEPRGIRSASTSSPRGGRGEGEGSSLGVHPASACPRPPQPPHPPSPPHEGERVLGAQLRPHRLLRRRHDPRRQRFDLGVGQRLARAAGWSPRRRRTSCPPARPGPRRRRTPARRRSAPCRRPGRRGRGRRPAWPGRPRRRSRGCSGISGESASAGLVFTALLLRLRDRLEPDLEAVDRARRRPAPPARRVQLAELGQHRLGPELQPRRAARLPPGRGSPWATCRLADRRAELVQQRHQVALQREQRRPRRRRPSAAGACGASDGGDRGALVAAARSPANTGPISNRAHVGEAALGVAAGRLDQVRQDRGAHAVELGGDRVGQHQVRPRRRRTARPLAGDMNDQVIASA